jgi:hypothetical protein
MVAFPIRNLNQKAVYWGSPTPNGFGGFTWDDPVEIDCRWEDSNRQITIAKGEQIISRAEVQVNQDLDGQGILYLGELNDLTVAQKADPTIISNAFSIKKFDKIPSLSKPVRYFRKAYL